jgi:hypothetical protein
MSDQEKNNASANLRQLHPRVRVLRLAMKTAPVIDHGPVKVEEAGNFNLWVSRAQMRRALLILDAVVKGLEAREATFVAGNWRTKHLVAKFQDGTVEFQIIEKMKHEQVLVRKEPVESGFICHHEWRYKPLGTLTFSILDRYPKGTRKKWHDCPRHRVEDKVGEIVEQMCKNPGLAKQHRERNEKERDEQKRQFYEAYLRASAPERLDEMKAGLKKEIEDQGRAWEKARATRDFLSACERAMQGDGNEPVREWQARWLGWGKEWVDSFDPLTNGFFSKLKQQFEELEELEAFVAQLNEEKAAETA